MFHKRSKNTDVRQNFVRDAEQKIHINILHVRTQKLATDIFTKGLCDAGFTEHRENIMGTLNPNSCRV